MALTPAQAATLKAAINADPTLAAMTSGPGTDFHAIAQAVSAPASPAFYVWKSSTTPEEFRAAIIEAADQLDNLTVGKRDALLYVVSGNIDSRIAARRAALDNLCGSQNVLKASIVAGQKRTANVVEKLLADTANGNGAVATPAVAVYEGSVSLNDVAALYL